jgi:hypothetical protein
LRSARRNVRGFVWFCRHLLDLGKSIQSQSIVAVRQRLLYSCLVLLPFVSSSASPRDFLRVRRFTIYVNWKFGTKETVARSLAATGDILVSAGRDLKCQDTDALEVSPTSSK